MVRCLWAGTLPAAAAEWQAGDWYVDRNAAWTEPFIEQITIFPDDQADMMSQASAWLMRRDIPTVQIYNFTTRSPGGHSTSSLEPVAKSHSDSLVPLIAAWRTPLSLLSGWGCRDPSLSRAEKGLIHVAA
jgi:hypothetical protein